MSAMQVHLLGKPCVIRDDGPAVPPRGRKAWALLAYLLLSEGSHTRQHLASLLFAEAEDPLGALRWNLAELRHLLGVGPEAAPGTTLVLPHGTLLDTEVVSSGDWSQALRMPGLGKELLEGMSFATSPPFEAWLAAERSRLAAAGEAVLSEAVLDHIAAGNFESAAELAARLLQLNPLDENHHALLIRSLAAGGRHEAARRQARACEDLFERELGIRPTAMLADALRARPVLTAPTSVSPVAAARVQLEAGEAAIRAGAVRAGLECLRRAVSESAECGDGRLLAEALVSLGGALIHAAQGRDQEGKAVLHEALNRARAADARPLLAQACRELAYVDVNLGRPQRAELWLQRAEDWAAGDASELASIYGNRGKSLSDRGHYEEGLSWLERSLELAGRAGDRAQVAWSLSLVGRGHLLRRELEAAEETITECISISRSLAWNAFLPWPELLLGELYLVQGRSGPALQAFEHALALGRQLEDVCWQTGGMRGLALVAAAGGREDAALGLLEEARARWASRPDTYVWVYAAVLDTQAGLLSGRGPAQALPVIDRLAELSARTGMDEFLVRAHLHRGRLGDSSALESARLLARSVDNPALMEALEGQ